ncbi:lysR substrate binding domain protein [Sutterella sp. CAG:351]|nr:lysR substrate binding domain protein [Sutterella sp. CAG:351]
MFGARDAVEKKEVILTREGKREALQFDPQVIVRNHMASLAAALAGLGVGLLIPAYLARPYLESGRLERLLPEWKMPSLQLLAFTGKEAVSPHLEGLIDKMQELFRENPDLEPSV